MMQYFQKSLIASGICMLMSMGAHADSTDTGASIKALMTPEQYTAAGLDKLSAAEREALYRWLQLYAGKPAAQIVATPPATRPAATAATVQPVTQSTVSNTPQEPPASTPAPIASQPVESAVVVAPAPVAASQASNESPAATAELEKNFGLPEPPDEAEAAYQLRASVLEPFRGWSGKTVFYLDNGQIWKQRTSGRHTYTGDDNRVVIGQNRMGFFEMRLIAVDRSVGVKRLK
jgi:hypothetical protein